MGTNFNAMSVRVAAAIQDTKSGTTSPITLVSDDGQKRSSAQRSKDIMAARFWIWSIYRVANKRMFFGSTALSFTGTGTGYADVTSLGITSVADLTLEETTAAYGKSIPIVPGDELQIYGELMKSSKKDEMVAGFMADHSLSTTQQFRLKLLLGTNLATQNTASYTFSVGYYANPLLKELNKDSAEDLTEPRPWWDAMERYAEHLGWKMSGNTDRAQIALSQANDHILFLISTEYGEDAAERVRRHLQRNS